MALRSAIFRGFLALNMDENISLKDGFKTAAREALLLFGLLKGQIRVATIGEVEGGGRR